MRGRLFGSFSPVDVWRSLVPCSLLELFAAMSWTLVSLIRNGRGSCRKSKVDRKREIKFDVCTISVIGASKLVVSTHHFISNEKLHVDARGWKEEKNNNGFDSIFDSFKFEFPYLIF